MNWEAFGSIAEFLGAIAVLATLVYLSRQIRQNTDMVQAQTRDAMTEKQMTWINLIAGNNQVAQVWSKGGASLSNLNTENAEAVQFNSILRSLLRMWENEYYQYQKGLFESEEFEARLSLWKGSFQNNPGRVEEWSKIKSGFAPGFRNLIDGFIVESDKLGK